MIFADKLMDKYCYGFMPGNKSSECATEAVTKDNYRRSILLVLAVTLHNIPEGLAVGVAFGELQ